MKSLLQNLTFLAFTWSYTIHRITLIIMFFYSMYFLKFGTNEEIIISYIFIGYVSFSSILNIGLKLRYKKTEYELIVDKIYSN